MSNTVTLDNAEWTIVTMALREMLFKFDPFNTSLTRIYQDINWQLEDEES